MFWGHVLSQILSDDNHLELALYTVHRSWLSLIAVPNDTNPRAEVAVIIPCYNAAPYLARALDSVFAQTHRDFCIYAIDDGSTDDTPLALRSYGSRVIGIRQSHAGQAAARNCGIRQSNSPYVAFLDADDEWVPEKLERQLKVLRDAHRMGMLYSDCATAGTGPFVDSYFASAGIPIAGRMFEQLLKTCSAFTPTVMLRRECLDDIGLFDESLSVGEDYNLWLRIASRWEVGVIPEVLAIRHLTPGSFTLTTSRSRVAGTVIAVFEQAMRACEDLSPQDRRALRLATAERYYCYGSHLLVEGDRRLSRQQLLQAWQYGLRDWRCITKLGLGLAPHGLFAMLLGLRERLKISRPQVSHEHRIGTQPSHD